jgi:hypothetical protein
LSTYPGIRHGQSRIQQVQGSDPEGDRTQSGGDGWVTEEVAIGVITELGVIFRRYPGVQAGLSACLPTIGSQSGQENIALQRCSKLAL